MADKKDRLLGYVDVLWRDRGDGTFAPVVSIDAGDIQIGAVELKNGVTDDRALISADGALVVSERLRVLGESEVTVTTAGTPVAAPANASARAVMVINNNVDGKKIVVGLQATVDALSTPPIGRVLNAYDATIVHVQANSNEVYIDSSVSSKKATVQILGV